MKNSDKPIYPDPMRGAESSIINQTPYNLPTGLTKREYFAGLAMQAIPHPVEFIGEKQTEKSYTGWARKCVKMADVILKQLEEKPI